MWSPGCKNNTRRVGRDRLLGTLSIMEINLNFILNPKVTHWGLLHKGICFDRCLLILQRKRMRGGKVGWEKVGKVTAIYWRTKWSSSGRLKESLTLISHSQTAGADPAGLVISGTAGLLVEDPARTRVICPCLGRAVLSLDRLMPRMRET